jgi:hypothetical protein
MGKFLTPLLSALALTEVKQRAERGIRNLVLAIIAGLMGAIAFGFLVAAIVIGLARNLGPVSACLIMTAVFVLVAILFWFTRRTSEPSRRGRITSDAVRNAFAGSRAGGGDTSRRPNGEYRPSVMSKLTSNKAAIALPALAFAVAVLAGRRARPRHRHDGRYEEER